MRFYLYIIFALIITSCATIKSKKNSSTAIKYKVAYNYLLKNKYIDSTYEISDTITSIRFRYFSGFFCKIDKSKVNKNDTIPSPELLRVVKCNDSLVELDRKNEIVPYFFPLKNTLNNYNKDADYLIHFSNPVDDVITIIVCQLRENNFRLDCDFSHWDTYYLKIPNDSVIEFYMQPIH